VTEDPLHPTDDDVEAHRLASNDNEIAIEDDESLDDHDDVEAHRLAANDNETVVDDEDEPEPPAA
jgi:hypothetical protein